MIKRKQATPKRGDIFEFVVADGRFGYGIVVIGGGVPYVAIYSPLFGKRPSITELTANEIALAGQTMDALFFHGRWIVIAEGLDPPVVPFPNWKVGVEGVLQTTNFEGTIHWPMRPDERDVLDYKFSRAPIAYQTAFEALHGLAEWRDDYERLRPEYAARRVTRL